MSTGMVAERTTRPWTDQGLRILGWLALVLAGAVAVGQGSVVGIALLNSTGLPDQNDATNLLAVPIGVLPLVVFGAWVVTALWLTEARALGRHVSPAYRVARSGVWTWLGWLVPVVNLWFPYQVVRDAHRATTLRRGSGSVRRDAGGAPVQPGCHARRVRAVGAHHHGRPAGRASMGGRRKPVAGGGPGASSLMADR